MNSIALEAGLFSSTSWPALLGGWSCFWRLVGVFSGALLGGFRVFLGSFLAFLGRVIHFVLSLFHRLLGLLSCLVGILLGVFGLLVTGGEAQGGRKHQGIG
ncbi:Uncharacterized membrane protein YjjP [Pseudomonas syringae pv. actinidiae]|uniref:Uncharacterized membrane protein YjjP n=1 Tax=Pseudomonas syringae pv. actinidiae TaxID=103796 RepID=A0A2V0RD86_PSESF|nr:Uncharacterized membrane protein YjjP [Pseudomonas syringae pv. actinidiae]GBH18770.1 Uncharacterized membrane protein YjjP [Pseudomonas syringae pv. actinidiae]